MTFEEILDQAIALLQRRGRVTYRMLKRQFQLEDEALADLKAELIKAQRLAVDEDGEVLVWTGGASPPPTSIASPPPRWEAPQAEQRRGGDIPPAEPRTADAERRQLTVLFCDLVDSTVFASQLDPEEWREVVRTYQDTCAKVIARFEGHIAQYLGDGVLVYFGYPRAHEDDAQRAVRAALGIIEAMDTLNTRLKRDKSRRLAVRIGIHTGLVVVGEMGGGRQEHLALGDTPNVAARLQGLAAPDTVVIGGATHQLVQGYFMMAALGPQSLKGIATPVPVYRILGASAAQSRLDVAAATGVTPWVGRASEVALLLERWAQSQAGQGQVVLLSGEGGIGKSRLVEVLRERVVGESGRSLAFRCSPYHTQSALYPIIEHLRRVLDWGRDETSAATLRRLETVFAAAHLPLDETMPLLAALLSVPIPEGRYPPMVLTPPQQRQRTLDALTRWLLAAAEQQPILVVWEDLHWADPSTLELLGLIIDQVPTARLLTLTTARPEFRPPWASRSHVTQLTLGRLPHAQVGEMVQQLTSGKALPSEVLTQVIAKTDGVPLFVEELVKMLLESGLLREEVDSYVLTGPLPPLAIPATLQDSLMARLDRLVTARAVAQLGAVLGREFSDELIRAGAWMDDATVQRGLAQLVEAELLYRRGSPPRARYVFKHALIQETAYQSLLRSTRQQYHQRIAQVLTAQFPEVVETQPELVAQHYTEAGLGAQAIPYWQRAGERAIERSAYLEARAHLTKGLEVLKTVPDTPERTQQELGLQTTLGGVLIATQGGASPDVERAYARARELCRQVGETPQLFPTLRGLHRFYLGRGQTEAARELGEQLLSLAQRVQDPVLLVPAHLELGSMLFSLGELVSARTHLEQGIALYDPQQYRSIVLLSRSPGDPGVVCRGFAAWTLWVLGYPDQAFKRSDEALILVQQLAHPVSHAAALYFAAVLHYFRREEQAALERAETLAALAREQGFAQPLSAGTILRGWALAMQGQGEEGLAQMRQGIAARKATGSERTWLFYLAMLAEAYQGLGQAEAGLNVLAEALVEAHTTVARYYEAELDRLKGELLLVRSPKYYEEAEACFRQAVATARRQQAKSWELRAAMSLSRLWQRQGKRAAAHELLTPIYSWFTEGFDTADLQDAKALLEEISE